MMDSIVNTQQDEAPLGRFVGDEWKVDFHGYYPDEVQGDVCRAVEDAYDAGAKTLRLIHGHGHNRFRPYALFANTNTGPLGVAVRRTLRENREGLRQWMYVKFDSSDDGSTAVRIRPRREGKS